MKLGDAMKPAAKEWKKMKKVRGGATPPPLDDKPLDDETTPLATPLDDETTPLDDETTPLDKPLDDETTPLDDSSKTNLPSGDNAGGKSRKTKQKKLRKTKKNIKKKSLKK